jgi:pilus assembly protein CpaC
MSRLVLAIAAALVFAAQGIARAEAPQVLQLTVGHSTLLPMPSPIRRIAVADPATVEIMPIENTQLYVLGKKTGSTNLLVWLAGDAAPRSLLLQVERDVTPLRDALRDLLPEEKNITVAANGDHVILSGALADPLALGRVLEIARSHAGDAKLSNLLKLPTLPQVMLEVKVAEVSKTLIDRLGARINLTSDGARSVSFLSEFLSRAGASLSTVRGSDQFSLDLEERKGLIKILAEPSILAMSGEQGEFLAGGKVFIPVAQAGTAGSVSGVVSLEEREFGVGVKFLPTVLPGGRINLKVAAEVSEISTTGTTVSSSGASSAVLPTITSRKTSTTVQLEDGQSFAVGGLTKDNVKGSAAGIPGLGSIPVLGALFRSSDFQNDRSELVFLVTVRLVREPGKVELPTDKLRGTSLGERIVTGELAKPAE